MKTFDQLAGDFAVFCDEVDLRRLREMNQAEFVMFLALHSAAELELELISKDGAA